MYYSRGGARGFIGLHGVAYLGMMVRVVAVSEMVEQDVIQKIAPC